MAPIKWIDLENAKLWWPTGINVKNKNKCNPDKDTQNYPVIDVLLEGKLNIFIL